MSPKKYLKRELLYATRIPRCMKQLARMVMRGFYTVEDALIVDLLIRHRCLKRVDIVRLLMLDKTMLRDRISNLRRDKFVVTQRQRPHCYYIDYKALATVTANKLLAMRKRIESIERAAFSTDSFRCTDCLKTFPELEADLLFCPDTELFRCHFCGNTVQEILPMPKDIANSLLAPFNEAMRPLYDKLDQVKRIRLAAHLLNPHPADISRLRCSHAIGEGVSYRPRICFEFSFDNDSADDEQPLVKEQPTWLSNSTIFNASALNRLNTHTTLWGASLTASVSSSSATIWYGTTTEVCSLSDSDTDDDMIDATPVPPLCVSEIVI